MAIVPAVVMAIVPAVVMVVHPMIVPVVAIVASFMVPIAAHKPERVQVAVVIVIGIAVVAVAVRAIGPGPCTSRQGDTDAKHQAWSKQRLPALCDTHDNLTITRVDKSSVNLTWAPTDAERCGDSGTLMGLLRAIRMSGVNQFRADAFRVGQP
jgi:hypothetical protein